MLQKVILILKEKNLRINCGYKYRIYPTKEQEKLLNHYFFVSNQAYNVCLDYQKETWERNRELPKKDRTYPKAIEIDAVVKNALNNRGDSEVIFTSARKFSPL